MATFLEFIKEPYNIISLFLIMVLLIIAFWRLSSLLKKEEVPKKYLVTIIFLFFLLFLSPLLELNDNNVKVYGSWLSSLFLAFFILSLQEASTFRANEKMNETYKEMKEIKNFKNSIEESTIEIRNLRKEIDNLTRIVNRIEQSPSKIENSKKSFFSSVYNQFKNKL